MGSRKSGSPDKPVSECGHLLEKWLLKGLTPDEEAQLPIGCLDQARERVTRMIHKGLNELDRGQGVPGDGAFSWVVTRLELGNVRLGQGAVIPPGVASFHLSPTALDDLDAVAMQAVRHGVDWAKNVVRDLVAAMELLGRPREFSGHSRQDLISSVCRLWHVPPYVIVYVPGAKPRIVCVLDGRRLRDFEKETRPIG